jgi:hypothetical protein
VRYHAQHLAVVRRTDECCLTIRSRVWRPTLKVVAAFVLIITSGCWGKVMIYVLFFVFTVGSLFSIGFMSLKFYTEWNEYYDTSVVCSPLFVLRAVWIRCVLALLRTRVAWGHARALGQRSDIHPSYALHQ